ncbi:MAG TPA: helix-turn-helix domain-containing protein [Albitalea sp.]
MTEVSAEPVAPRTAGSILREARQAQGLHIAALAASIKVAQKKLDALEADRLDELPDATFTRALAQTVCRALKIDPAPVLALLPGQSGQRLEQVGGGINTPFRERPGRHEPSDWAAMASPAVWGPLLLVVGAAVLYLLPSGWLADLQLSPAPAASAPATSASGTSSMTIVMPPEPIAEETPVAASAPQVPASAPVLSSAEPASAPAVAAAPPAGMLQMRTTAQSWVEVRDARSTVLLARMLEAGETVALDGVAPLKLKIGNAGATEVVFRGQPMDLAPSTRDNVARLELK